MLPPIEKSNADSDVDSDESDDPDANINHLPGRLLTVEAEVSRGRKATAAEEDPADDEEKTQQILRRVSVRNKELVTTPTADTTPADSPPAKKTPPAKKMRMDPIYGEVEDFSSGTITTISTTTTTTATITT